MTTRALRRLSAVAATIAGSVLTSALILRIAPVSRDSHEYIAMGTWSVPLAAIVLLVARFGRYLRRRWGVAAAVVALPPLAYLSALAWAILVYAGTREVILGTFDANPLWSWAGGALCGLTVATAWQDRPHPSSPLADEVRAAPSMD
jgi:uncharacterized membrane protein